MGLTYMKHLSSNWKRSITVHDEVYVGNRVAKYFQFIISKVVVFRRTQRSIHRTKDKCSLQMECFCNMFRNKLGMTRVMINHLYPWAKRWLLFAMINYNYVRKWLSNFVSSKIFVVVYPWKMFYNKLFR